MLRTALVALAVVACMRAESAQAETRGTLRLGVQQLALQASSDTPIVGERVVQVVDDYNAAAATVGPADGAGTARIDASDLGITERLLVVAPGLEISAGHYFFRVEAPIGHADGLTTVGIGIYPLNAQFAVGRRVAMYLSGGGTASWLDRDGAGDIGGLVSLRAAAGLRIAQRLIVEGGYGVFTLGGSVNRDRLADMAGGQPMPLARPDEAIAAGEARGGFDVAVGVAF